MEKNNIDNNQIFPFTLDKEPYKGKSYLAFSHFVCDNPLCKCSDISFYIKELDEKGEIIQQDPPNINYSFTIDILKKEVSKHFRNKIDIQSMKFANHFLGELTPDFWKLLFDHFYEHKRKLLSDSKTIDNLKVDFSEAEYKIEKENHMICFKEILPNTESMTFIYDNVTYLVDDQYCLASSCHCTHTGLNIIALSGKNENNEKIKFDHDYLVVVYDYIKGTWQTNLKFKIVKHTEIEIIRQMEIAFPEIRRILRERHRMLRRIYANYRKGKDKNKPISNSVQKVGRNDPCPCGSGKKYKHCCAG